MLIRLTSDIHMEQFVHQTVPFQYDWASYMVPPMDRDAEAVLVLAGDICEFQYITHYSHAFKDLAARFKAVVYVPGNHEYCGSQATPHGRQTFFYFKELLRRYGKIHLLDNSSVVIDGVKFYGTSLWTEYNGSPIAANICSGMWDFRHGYIDDEGETRLTRPVDYIGMHAVAKQALLAQLAKKEDIVVVSHFAPSHGSMHEKYRNQTPFEVNYHFVNSLDQEIMDNPEIKLWIHGHTHTQFDYDIGSTRVVCNPRGFPTEDTCPIGELDYIEV